MNQQGVDASGVFEGMQTHLDHQTTHPRKLLCCAKIGTPNRPVFLLFLLQIGRNPTTVRCQSIGPLVDLGCSIWSVGRLLGGEFRKLLVRSNLQGNYKPQNYDACTVRCDR